MTELFQAVRLRRPPVRYHGSKWTIAPWIISHFSDHRVYCEAFGGGAAVLFRKPRSLVEIYNDLDDEVVRFFEVLRDPVSAGRLARLLELSPYSRTEFENAFDTAADEVESARRFMVRSYLGFGTHSHNADNSNGFRAASDKRYAVEWVGVPNALRAAVSRLRGVIFERRNALELILRHDSADTLFFLDPPYIEETRNGHGKGYRFEMSAAEHHVLARILHSVKAKVVLCGYPSAAYDRDYADWLRVSRPSYASGQSGRVDRTEVLWLNFAPYP